MPGSNHKWIFALALFGLTTDTGLRAGEVRPPLHAAITLIDQNGKVAPISPPSPSGTTVDVSVGSGGLTFSPAAVSILIGDSVKWTWFASGHNVRSGTPCTSPDSAFCSTTDTNCTANGLSNSGTTYTHTFSQAGVFQYYCSQHCASGMKGTITVTVPSITIAAVTRDATGLVTITGQTMPNLTIQLESSPDLVTAFGNAVAVTANGSGGFTFTETNALPARFYRGRYP